MKKSAELEFERECDGDKTCIICYTNRIANDA